jgi:hypothetical protein
MHDRGALVFDVVHPGLLCDRPRLGRNQPELEPEGLSADGGRLLGDPRAEFRSPKDVHEVDGFVDFAQGLGDGDAEDLGPVGPHRDHPVALLEEIPHHAVARALRPGRGAHEGNCVG